MTYTAEQIDAARAVRATHLRLTDASRQEPRRDSPTWPLWRTRWEAAYQEFETAEDAYRLLFPGPAAPPPVTRLLLQSSINPLRPTSDPTVWATLDRAFVAGKSSRGGVVLDWYGIPNLSGPSHTSLTLHARDLTGAQQLVDWIGWATTYGGRRIQDRVRQAIPA